MPQPGDPSTTDPRTFSDKELDEKLGKPAESLKGQVADKAAADKAAADKAAADKAAADKVAADKLAADKAAADKAAADKVAADKVAADKVAADKAAADKAAADKVAVDKAAADKAAADKVAADKAAADKAAADKLAADKSGAEGLIAGKFKTNDELVKAVEDTAATLKLNTKIIAPAIALAKESGRYNALADMYTALEEEQQAKAAAERGASEKPTLPSKAPVETEEERSNREAIVQQHVMDELRGSDIAKELEKAGITFPETQDAVQEAYNKNPWLLGQFSEEFRKRFEAGNKVTLDHRNAVYEVTPHNDGVISGQTEGIMKMMTDLGLPAKREEIEVFVRETYQKDRFALEDRVGVAFFRDGYAKQAYTVANLDKILEQRRILDQREARAQYDKDMKEIRERSVQSISTLPIPSSPERLEEKKVDVNDREAVARLSDAELDRLIAHPEERK
jgi:hypothetical protein